MPRLDSSFRVLASVLSALVVAGCTPAAPPVSTTADVSVSQGSRAQILAGRQAVLTHACGDCHGGGNNPAAMGWLAGVRGPEQEFKIGPCYVTPGAQPCWTTRPKNLTPDSTTGIGRYSERQIFNALRYGLRPQETPDAPVTSITPGQGNFPANPHYLAPPMPWPWWRHMTDDELKAIAAYLKRGLRPVNNRVLPSEGPPDLWASEYTPEKIGTAVPPAFPTAQEVMPAGSAEFLQKVARGRHLTISHACGACHGGPDPASAN